LLRAYANRILAMKGAGDLLLLGNGVAQGPDTAFPWEFGSHGGFSAGCVEAFLAHPAAAQIPEIVVPEDLHAVFAERYALAGEGRDQSHAAGER
jgi:hypothetical protein